MSYHVINHYCCTTCLSKFLFIYKIVHISKQDSINRNLLNYILSTQLNSAQNSYEFYADSNRKIIGVIKINNSIFSNNRNSSIPVVNDITKRLISNDNSTSSYIENCSSNKLTPVFERFTIFSPIVMKDFKNMKKLLFYSYAIKKLTKDELQELQLYSFCHNGFKVKNKTNYTINEVVFGIMLSINITICTVFTEIYENLGNKIIITSIETVIAISLLFLFIYINRLIFYKSFKRYNSISNEKKYRQKGLFVVESNYIFYLVKISNYKSDRPVQALQSSANNIIYNDNNANLEVDYDINEIVTSII